ncbi:MAG: SIS domain-containing protein [Oscillospiraceae bacterium]|nr:SIS domain-containing protein [Oscillospiraceae bacterium]
MKAYHEIYDEVLRIERDAIDGLLTGLDRAVMDQITDLLLHVRRAGKKVVTAGCGTSGIAAQKIAHILSVIEVPAVFLSPSNAVHGGIGVVSEGDVVILLTKGGNTAEIVRYLPICKAKGATVIGVTQKEDSILGREADIFFRVAVEREACPWNLIASAGIVAVIAAFDAIAFAVLQYSGFTKEQFHLIHPGGGAGEALDAEAART